MLWPIVLQRRRDEGVGGRGVSLLESLRAG